MNNSLSWVSPVEFIVLLLSGCGGKNNKQGSAGGNNENIQSTAEN